jgi:hypothetical protein
MLYREYNRGNTAASTNERRLSWLIDEMAATDDPEVIADFEIAIEAERDNFDKAAVQMLDTANDLTASVEAIEAEIKRLGALAMERERRAQRLRDAILRYMTDMDTAEIVTDLYTVKRRKNPPAVEILNEIMIADEFRRVQVVEKVTIDKKAIAELLKSGVPVDGATLKQTYRLEVK